MIEIIMALFIALGFSPAALSQVQSGLNEFENPEGIGSTANGTTTILVDGEVWVISVDEKGNYIVFKK
jgi:hypothetical protein